MPEQLEHAAVAYAYAHVTAPLRRLVDRFGLVACEALSRGAEVPEWVREALPPLPEIMAASDRRAGAVERGCADAVEAAVLPRPCRGHVSGERGRPRWHGRAPPGGGPGPGPAVLARADGQAELGAAVTVRLVEAEIASGTVRFEIVS